MLLSMLKSQPKKRCWIGLAALFVVLMSPRWASASHKGSSYRTQLGRDLDGDHIPESATIRHCGFVYQINIHFSTGRPRLRLTTYVAEGVADLSIEISDVDNDRQEELVITSATSIRPVAVWRNVGKAKFQKVSSWAYGGLRNYTGPKLMHHSGYQPEPILSICGDPIPHVTPTIQDLDIEKDPESLTLWAPEQLPSDSVRRQITARGPPPASHS